MLYLQFFIFLFSNLYSVLNNTNVFVYYETPEKNIYDKTMSLAYPHALFGFKFALAPVETAYYGITYSCYKCNLENICYNITNDLYNLNMTYLKGNNYYSLNKDTNLNLKEETFKLIKAEIDNKFWLVLVGNGNENFNDSSLYFINNTLISRQLCPISSYTIKNGLKNIYFDINNYFLIKKQIKNCIYGFDFNFAFKENSLKEEKVINWLSDLIIKIKQDTDLKDKKIALTLPTVNISWDLFYGYTYDNGLSEDEKNFIKKVNDNVVFVIGKENLDLGICFDVINKFFNMQHQLHETPSYSYLDSNWLSYINATKNMFNGLKEIFSSTPEADIKNLMSITFKLFYLNSCISSKSDFFQVYLTENISLENCYYNYQPYKDFMTLVLAEFKKFGIRHYGFYLINSDFENSYLDVLYNIV